MIEVLNLVGGEFVGEDESFDDISPLNNQIVASVPRTKNVESAVSAAELAIDSWSNLSLQERCDWLDIIADELESQIEEVARLESIDTGKPNEVALNVDAKRSVYNFRFFADFSQKLFFFFFGLRVRFKFNFFFFFIFSLVISNFFIMAYYTSPPPPQFCPMVSVVTLS